MAGQQTPARARLHLEGVIARWRRDHKLTEAESAVVRQVLRGRSNKEVGSSVGTSPATVRTQLASVLRKVGVASRTELAFAAFCQAYGDDRAPIE